METRTVEAKPLCRQGPPGAVFGAEVPTKVNSQNLPKVPIFGGCWWWPFEGRRRAQRGRAKARRRHSAPSAALEPKLPMAETLRRPARCSDNGRATDAPLRATLRTHPTCRTNRAPRKKEKARGPAPTQNAPRLAHPRHDAPSLEGGNNNASGERFRSP